MTSRIFSFDFGLPGGVRTYSQNITVALQIHGYEAYALQLQNISGQPKRKLLIDPLGNNPPGKYTIHQLFKKLAICDDDTIILHDPSTMEYFAQKTFKSKICIVLHGDYEYYIHTALKYSNWADRTFAVTKNLCKRVNQALNQDSLCTYLPPTIPHQEQYPIENKQLKATFIGRNTQVKGAHHLPEIDRILESQGIQLKWSVISSSLKESHEISDLHRTWTKRNKQVSLYFDLDIKGIQRELKTSRFFILPSYAEGFPMSLLESMSAGCIPLCFQYGPDAVEHLPPSFKTHVSIDNDPEYLARKMTELIQHSNLDELSKHSIRHCLAHHKGISEQVHQILSDSTRKLKSPGTLFIHKIKRKIRRLLSKLTP